METPAQAGRRLLAALDDLVSQETAAVHADDFVALESVQLRAAAVGEKLISLAADPAVAALRRQVEILVAQRWQNGLVLRQRLADVGAEISRLQGAKARLLRVAPAYSTGPVPLPRFTAAA
jgi:hypothetical protein